RLGLDGADQPQELRGIGRAALGIGPALIENGLLLRHGRFDAPPLAPEQAVGRAKREQSKRLLANRGGLFRGRLSIRFDVRGERGVANGIRPASALTIELGENGVDTEERRGRPHRSALGAGYEIDRSVAGGSRIGCKWTG